MFVGHLAVALVAKKLEPRIPLAVLVAASFGLDLLWPLLLFAGIETVRVDPGNTAFTALDFQWYPWTHSLAAAGLWGAAAGWVVFTRFKNRRAAWLVGILVVSHWVLDVVTHRPDLPLWPAGPKVGLALWNSIGGTIAVEGALFFGGLIVYTSMSQPRDGIGRWALWALVALVTLIWLAGPWSPPPPSATAVAAVALAMWLFPPWAHWIERHRVIDVRG